MTKLFSCCLLLFFCTIAAQGQTAVIERNKATLLRVCNEVFSQGKLDAIDGIFSPAVVDHNKPNPQLPDGIAGVKAVVSMFHQAFPDFTMRQVDAFGEGNKVTQRWIASGTMKGSFMGAAPTGKSFTSEGIDIIYFDADGRITDRWGQFDVLGMLMQLGLQK
jgi:predicted ester cyclase